MPPIDLVTSVPNLHTARILAAAGIPYIAFLQSTPNLGEIVSWIEGPEIFVQIIDTNLPIPQVDNLIIPYAWHDQFSFMDKRIWWMTEDISIEIPDGMIYNSVDLITSSRKQSTTIFYPYRGMLKGNDGTNIWIDYEQDGDLYEELFL